MRMEGPIPMLRARDLARTLVFYRDDLGMGVLGTFEQEGKTTWACLGTPERDQLMLMTMGPESPEANHTVYYFKPDDVKALHARMRARGLEASALYVTVYGMREFHMKDPDGRTLTFGQETSDPPDCREEGP